MGRGEKKFLHTCIAPGSRLLLLLSRVAEGVGNLVHVPSVCGHGIAKAALCKRTRVHEDLAEANVLFRGQGNTTEHSGDKRGREHCRPEFRSCVRVEVAVLGFPS